MTSKSIDRTKAQAIGNSAKVVAIDPETALQWRNMKHLKLFIVLFVLAFASANAQMAIFSSHKKHDPTISVTVSNCTSSPIKLWQQDCYWGWANFSVEFISPTNRFLIKRRLIDWPLNVPSFYSLPPKGTNTIVLRLEPVYWKFPAGFSITNDFPARVIYSVEKTAESQSHDVLTGEFSSDFEWGR